MGRVSIASDYGSDLLTFARLDAGVNYCWRGVRDIERYFEG